MTCRPTAQRTRATQAALGAARTSRRRPRRRRRSAGHQARLAAWDRPRPARRSRRRRSRTMVSQLCSAVWCGRRRPATGRRRNGVATIESVAIRSKRLASRGANRTSSVRNCVRRTSKSSPACRTCTSMRHRPATCDHLAVAMRHGRNSTCRGKVKLCHCA